MLSTFKSKLLTKIQIFYPNAKRELCTIIADDAEKLFDFISGSALIPYMERLLEEQSEIFIGELKKRIEKTFSKFPVIYSFKRLLLMAKCKIVTVVLIEISKIVIQNQYIKLKNIR